MEMFAAPFTLSILLRGCILLRGQCAKPMQLLLSPLASTVHFPKDVFRNNKFSTHVLDTCMEFLLLCG